MPDTIPLYVGLESPSEAAQREGFSVVPTGASEPTWHSLSDPNFLWAAFEPRWDGENTSDCGAAIVPSGDYFSQPPESLRRFQAATAARGEQSLVICEAGQYKGPLPPEPPIDVWMRLSDGGGQVTGHILPRGIRLELPRTLSSADRDLGLRLRGARAQGPWYGLTRAGLGSHPEGSFDPVLVSDVGEIVAAVYVSANQQARWYLLPFGLPWEAVLDWLESQAIPDFVPQAMARARRTVEKQLLTSGERKAQAELEAFEKRVQGTRAALQAKVKQAKTRGDKQRYPLLYESGRSLADAVASVLRETNLSVEKLDDTFGSGRSGDLLVSKDGLHWLVEVTSSSGSASEVEVGKLLAHIETWPRLRKEELQGGVLIINHDHRLVPSERPPGPYRRQERVETLKVTVLGTVTLCRWWAERNHEAIVSAITGPPGQIESSLSPKQ